MAVDVLRARSDLRDEYAAAKVREAAGISAQERRQIVKLNDSSA